MKTKNQHLSDHDDTSCEMLKEDLKNIENEIEKLSELCLQVADFVVEEQENSLLEYRKKKAEVLKIKKSSVDKVRQITPVPCMAGGGPLPKQDIRTLSSMYMDEDNGSGGDGLIPWGYGGNSKWR